MPSQTPTIHRSIVFWTLSLLLYCIGVALFTQQNYQTNKQQLLEGVDRQLLTAAYFLSAGIADKFQDLALRRDSEPDTAQLANAKLLADYAEKASVDRLYSLVVMHKQVLITASNSTQEPHGTKALATRLVNNSQNALGVILEANRTGRVQSYEFTESNGHFRSVLVPLRTANGTRYIAAADVDISALYNTLETEIYRSVLAAILLFFFSCPFLYTVIRMYASQSKSAHQELQKRLQELALSKRINNQYLMTFRVNAVGHIIEISDAYTKKTGIDTQHLIGNHFKELFADHIDYEHLRAIHEAIANGKTLEFHNEHPQENNRSFYAKVNVLPWAPELSDRRNGQDPAMQRELLEVHESGAVFIVEDLSYVKQLEVSRSRDEQTRLYNRRYFNEIVPNEINRARRENRELMMLLLELDPNCVRTQTEQSAQVIPVIAHKLQRLCQRSSDYVFRLDEYEFAIVCTIDTPKSANAFTNKVHQHVQSAIQLLNDDLRETPQQCFALGMSLNSPLAPLSLGEFYRRAHQSLQQHRAALNEPEANILP